MSGNDLIGLRAWAEQAIAQTETRLAGLREVAQLCLVAYCTRGHVLLEGNPGLGKTELVKALARAVDLQWGRIQFTPDLMPSDITGTMLPDYQSGASNRWAFDPGPVFTSLLLADEINRATPKTQAALLEAMAEGQVTVLGQTYLLPEPFLVLATQNPIDQVGTYALPEAQADRFMFKILMPTPDKEAVARILKYNQRVLEAGKANPPSGRRALYAACNPAQTRSLQLTPDEEQIQQRYGEARRRFRLHAAEIDRLGMPDDPERQKDVALVGLQEHVRKHLINIFLATNRRFHELEGLDDGQRRRVEGLSRLLAYGLGPRAVINLMRAARAWALLFGSARIADAERLGNAESLAHVLTPILRHRIKLSFDWEDLYQEANQKELRATPPPFAFQGDRLAVFLADLCVSTAPSAERNAHYRELITTKLGEVLGLEVRRR